LKLGGSGWIEDFGVGRQVGVEVGFDEVSMSLGSQHAVLVGPMVFMVRVLGVLGHALLLALSLDGERVGVVACVMGELGLEVSLHGLLVGLVHIHALESSLHAEGRDPAILGDVLLVNFTSLGQILKLTRSQLLAILSGQSHGILVH
jgi:hypothetical protein